MLRVVAIVVIVLYHFLMCYPKTFYGIEPSSLFFDRLGQMGVSVFLIISGVFLIGRKKNIFEYWFNRLFRIWPTYFVSIVIIFIVTSVYKTEYLSSTASTFALNSFFVNGFIGKPYVDGAHWFLTVLIAAIFIAGFCQLFNGKRLFIFLFAWLAVNLATNLIVTDNSTVSLGLKIISKITGGKYLGFLLIGTSFGLYLKNRSFIALSIMIAFSLLYIFLLHDFWYYIIAMAASVIVAICYLKVIPCPRFFATLGEYSFSLFLIHQYIGYVIINFLESCGVDFSACIIIALLMVLSLSVFLHLCIEKPFDKLRFLIVSKFQNKQRQTTN